jgi:hypothetical protein
MPKRVPKAKCICKNCGKEFGTYQCEVRRGGGIFCSKPCEYQFRVGKPLPKEVCDKRSASLKGRTITWGDKISASMTGKPNWRKGIPVSEIQKQKQREKMVGIKHTPEHNALIRQNTPKGEDSPHWNGGHTTLYWKVRYCRQMYEWRDAVFKRDNYRDWYSGVKGNGNLNAHHIVSFASLMERYNIQTLDDALACNALWDVANGVTMIDTVHMAHHSMWGDA